MILVGGPREMMHTVWSVLLMLMPWSVFSIGRALGTCVEQRFSRASIWGLMMEIASAFLGVPLQAVLLAGGVLSMIGLAILFSVIVAIVFALSKSVFGLQGEFSTVLGFLRIVCLILVSGKKHPAPWYSMLLAMDMWSLCFQSVVISMIIPPLPPTMVLYMGHAAVVYLLWSYWWPASQGQHENDDDPGRHVSESQSKEASLLLCGVLLLWVGCVRHWMESNPYVVLVVLLRGLVLPLYRELMRTNNTIEIEHSRME